MSRRQFSVAVMIIMVALNSYGLASAANDLQVTLKCPLTVKAGTALNVTAVVNNNNCTAAVTFTRAYTSMMANPGTTLAGYGIWGPHVRSLTAKYPAGVTVPKATCDQYDNVITPGTFSVGSVLILENVPTTIVGKMANAYWGPLKTGGDMEAQGNCAVPVVQ